MVLVLSSRDKSLILTPIQVHEYSRTPDFSILGSRNSNVSTRESSFEDQVETVSLPLNSTVTSLLFNDYEYLN